MCKIYKIVNDINDKVYVGSTCLSLEKRFETHKNIMNNKTVRNRALYQEMRQLGSKHFHIELIEEVCPCNSKSELRSREGYWIRKLDAHINGYNKQIADRTNKQWKAENRSQILSYHKNYNKQYYLQNKNKLLEKYRHYRHLNRNKILEYNKKKFICICGSQISRINKARHLRSKRHLKYLEFPFHRLKL